jgi:hypothetical protein
VAVAAPGDTLKVEAARSSLRLSAAALLLVLTCAALTLRAPSLAWFGFGAWLMLGFVTLVSGVVLVIALACAWEARGSGRRVSAVAGIAAAIDLLALVGAGVVVFAVVDLVLRAYH